MTDRSVTDADWTIRDGDWSPEFFGVATAVEAIIRSNGDNIVNGHAERTARAIVDELAHKFGMVPIGAYG